MGAVDQGLTIRPGPSRERGRYAFQLFRPAARSGVDATRRWRVRYLERLATEPTAWVLILLVVSVTGSVLYLALSSITF
jgi:hypothetical protein